MNEIVINFGLLFFRTAIGSFMLIGHGWDKLQKLISGDEIKFLDPFGIGTTMSFSYVVFAEFFASAFIVLGLLNRISNLSLIITMTVAVFVAHAEDPFSTKEKALLYLASYVLLYLSGPGRFSIQTLLNKKISSKNRMIRLILS